MGCVDSKETRDEDRTPYSRPRSKKESWRKKRKSHRDDHDNEFTDMKGSDQNHCLETSRKHDSNAELSDKYNSNESIQASARNLECHVEVPRERASKSNSEFLNKNNCKEAEKPSEQYSDKINSNEDAESSNSYESADADDSDESYESANTEMPCIKGVEEPPAGSLSVMLRKKGNELYTSVTKSMDIMVKYQRYNKASDCYCRAFEAATTDEESVSAAKNAAMAHWRLAETGIKQRSTAGKTIRHYKEAFRFFSFAFNEGNKCNTLDWRLKLCSSVDSCWLDFTKTTDMHFSLHDRIDLYYQCLQGVEIDHLKGNLYFNLAKFHFRKGVTAIQEGYYQRGLSEMNNCSMPIHEARKQCMDVVNIGRECDTLEDDIVMHTCTAEAMQAIDVGDKLFVDTIKGEEEINMDMVWEVVDWYKVAILRTRERTEMEQEAIAASRIGKIYDKILKMRDRAKEYFMRSIQLAHSMHPRTFTWEDWFKDASSALQKYQEEKQAEDDAEWSKAREEIKKEMKEQLDELEEGDKKRDLEFLDFVYKKYPPKNPVHKKLFVLPEDTSDIDTGQTKKLYQKAVVNYHPDRANVEENGLQWKVMTEEITKRLTRRYNQLKGS